MLSRQIMSSVVGSRGLLLMSSKRTQFAARARQCLLSVKQEKCDTLYIYFMKEHDSSSDPIKSKPTSTYQHEMTTSVLSHYTSLVYSQASAICPSIDVRLLLKHRELTSLRTLPSNAPLPSSSHSNSNGIENPMCRPLSSIECILAESCIPRQEVDHFLETNILRSHYQAGEIPFKVIDSEVALADNHDVKIHVDQTQDSINGLEIKKDEYRVVVLGGTFDRLHNGHKVLLMESVIRCTSEIIIGVTDDTMIQKKSLCDLIQPTALRIANVVDFLRDVAPSLIHRVVPIHDAFGPAILEDNIDLIVVSEETSQGAKRINEIRAEKNFHPLLVHTIQLFPEVSKESEHEEDKISSSSKRLRLLGQRLKLAMKPPSKPYIIGLTGGIASGKSNICKYLEEVHEISTIDCDKLGHEAYKPNTPCLEQIVSIFGSDILNSDGGIERRSLGSLFVKYENKIFDL